MATDHSIRININPAGATAGAASYSRSIGQIRAASAQGAASVATMEKGFGRLKSAAFSLNGVLVGLGIGIGIISGAKVLRDFGEAMSGVEAVTRSTQEEMAQLNETARFFGATTRFSATEAAQGMEFLGLAGFKTNEILEALGDTLNLAAAGNIDLGQAADIASNVLKQFNLEANETTRVTDVLANTAASTNTNIIQLAEAMKLAGPIAANLNIEIEELAAAIGVLGNAGIQGSRAGTGLRIVFASLLDPAPKAEEAIARLGLSMADVDIEARGLIKVFESFAETNLDAASAVQIFQRRGTAIALTLANQAKVTKAMTEANISATGAALAMAKVMEDNLFGASKQVVSALQEMVLQAGDRGAEGALRGLLDTMTAAIRGAIGLSGSYEEVARALEINSKGQLENAEALRKIGPEQEEAADRLVTLSERTLALAEHERLLGERSENLARTFGLIVDAVTVLAAMRLGVLVVGWATSFTVAAGAMANFTTMLHLASAAIVRLNAAFAFLGGPVGLLIGAVTVLQLWILEQNKAREASEKLTDEMLEQSKALGDLSAARLEDLEIQNMQRLVDLMLELNRARQRAIDMQKSQTQLGVSSVAADLEVRRLEKQIALQEEIQLNLAKESLRRQVAKKPEEEAQLGAPAKIDEEAIEREKQRLKDIAALFDATRTPVENFTAAIVRLNELQIKDQDLVVRGIELYVGALGDAMVATGEVIEATEIYTLALEELVKLQDSGTISQEQFAVASDRLAQTLEKSIDEIESSRTALEFLRDTAVSAGQAFASGFANAAFAGERFSDILKQLVIDTIRLIAQQQLLAAVMGIGGIISNFVGGLNLGGGGGFVAAVPATSVVPLTIPGGAVLPATGGFGTAIGQHGFDFTVPGSGPPDSVGMNMRLTPGERLIAIPPGGGGPAGGNVVVNVFNQPGMEATVDERENNSMKEINIHIIKKTSEDITRGGPIASAIGSRFGIAQGANAAR